jgi:hypothetical protein
MKADVQKWKPLSSSSLKHIERGLTNTQKQEPWFIDHFGSKIKKGLIRGLDRWT